jgi:hypothetical protein
MTRWTKVSIWLALASATSAACAQVDRSEVTPSTAARVATSSSPPQRVAHPAAPQGFIAEDTDALDVPVVATDRQGVDGRSGEDCSADSICGQDAGACGATSWWFYSDLQYCSSPPTTCKRVRCENFPPPGVTINKPIGIITWRGCYVDYSSNGCTKPQDLFRIRFYLDQAGAPANPLVGYYTEFVTATAVDTGLTVTFATVPATVWQFTAALTSPVALASGWFSICGDGTPGCYHLWEGSNEGDNKLYAWYEQGGAVPGAPVTDRCDLAYCFDEKITGACCDDCNGACLDNAIKAYCASLGGRFQQDTLCADLLPPCGQVLGACCFDDGTCLLTTCADCPGGTPIVIPAGQDCWTTQCGRTQYNFCDTPLPQDFFAPGSVPFDGIVVLRGRTGDSDTGVARLEEMVLAGLGSTATSLIALNYLDLVSCEPIVVMTNGQGVLWDVAVTLSAHAPPPGLMNVTRTHANGGTYRAEFSVQATFTFSRVSDPDDQIVLDTGAAGWPPLRFATVGTPPWVHTLAPGSPVFVCDTNFAPGVEEDPVTLEQCCRRVGHSAGAGHPVGHIHETEPRNCTDCPTGACCRPDGTCTVVVTIDECDALGGQYKGDGTDCRDSDGDGLPDVVETGDCSLCTEHDSCNTGSDPSDPDTDGDGISDGAEIAAGTLPCYPVGDLNCDGAVDFGDINPFVLFLSNFAAWQTTFQHCPATNGDINADGTYGEGSFGDINPFVALLTGDRGPRPRLVPQASESRAQGPHWAGWGTTCPDACCTVVVPPAAYQENEPNDCGPDTFNGGCNMATPLFSEIRCGWTIYGESSASDGYRDMDWYQTTIAGPRSFTVTVEAEFDVVIFAYLGNLYDCYNYRDIAAPATGAKCTEVVLATRCLPAGTYWFVVAPQAFDGVQCGSDYRITLECAGCDPCVIPSCPAEAYLEGTPPGYPLPGYCYCMADPNSPLDDDWENGGCTAEPPVFEVLPLDTGTVTFCGKLWATDGYRDLDWYGFDLALPSQVHWMVLSEVPCRATLVFDYLGGDVYGPPAGCEYTYYYWVDTLCLPCVPKEWSGTMYYEPGFYWFLLMPEDAAGPVWNGYPCPMGETDLGNDYTVTITLTGP